MNKLVLPNEIMLAEVRRLLAEGHPVEICAKGNSMLPFIRSERDSVELVRSRRYEVGDIVLAEIAPGQYVLHRLIACSAGEEALKGDGKAAAGDVTLKGDGKAAAGDVTLKGDGNLVGTEQCRAGDLCGKVARIIRPSGRTIDCSSAQFARRSKFWARQPYQIRRIILGLWRRQQLLATKLARTWPK